MVKLQSTLSPETARERGQRIKSVRNYLGLSIAKLCEKYQHYGLKVSTVSGWETMIWRGLTENGAKILTQAFRDEGAEKVTVEWLLFGVGESPIPTSFLQDSKSSQFSEAELIAEEIKPFSRHYPDFLDLKITEDGLVPYLEIGDHVAGKRYFGKDMEKAIGHYSIVELAKDKILVRMVKPGKDLGIYTLICTNPKTTVKQTEIKDVTPLSIAPVIWIRKPGVR